MPSMKVELLRRYRGALAAISAVLIIVSFDTLPWPLGWFDDGLARQEGLCEGRTLTVVYP